MIDVCLLGTGGMMPLPYRYLRPDSRYNGKDHDRLQRGDLALRKGMSPGPLT